MCHDTWKYFIYDLSFFYYSKGKKRLLKHDSTYFRFWAIKIIYWSNEVIRMISTKLVLLILIFMKFISMFYLEYEGITFKICCLYNLDIVDKSIIDINDPQKNVMLPNKIKVWTLILSYLGWLFYYKIFNLSCTFNFKEFIKHF